MLDVPFRICRQPVDPVVGDPSETGIGGVKTYRTLEGGGELAPKVVLAKLGLLTPQIEDFLEKLCRKGSNFGTPENSKFSPHL